LFFEIILRSRVAFIRLRRTGLAEADGGCFIDFMMCYVYVIKSESSNKIYIGQTADIDKRLKQHNDPYNNYSKYTKQNKGPWKLIYKEEVASRSEALGREKFLKSGKGREFIKKFSDR